MQIIIYVKKTVPLWSALLLLALQTNSFGQDEIRGGRIDHRNHYFEQGKAHFQQEEYTDALEHFNKTLSYDAYHKESYFLRAMTREYLGDDEGALTDYNIILHMAPEHTEALFGRGLLYFNMGKLDYAERDLLKLIDTPVKETNAIFFRLTNS